MKSCFLFLLILGFLSVPVHAELLFSGNVIATTAKPLEVDFALEQGALAQVKILDSNLVRVRFNPSGELSSRISPTLELADFGIPIAEISDASNFTLITTEKTQVVIGKKPFEIIVIDPGTQLIVRDATPAVGWNPETGLIISRKIAPLFESYFGFGLRGGPLNRRGRTFIMRNVDKFAYSEYSDPLYQSYPFYYGMREGRVYGIFWDNPAFPSFSMDAENNNVITYAAQKGELDYYIIIGPEMQTIANTYARLTGFTPLPPKWTLGYHHSRYGWKSQEEILGIAEELREQNFPCDILYFDIDYMDRLHIFSWDSTNFPDPIRMNNTLKSQGFKRINIMEPLLLTTDPLWPEADTAGYFLQDATGNSVANDIWYGHVSWVDFTKDAAADWYRNRLMMFLASGIDGLWNDLNEPAQNFMAEAIYDFNGDPRLDLEGRNLYALYHTKTSREAMMELRPNIRPWNFARSGTSGIQRYACTWSGDTTTSFDSLRVCIQISIHMGLSGQNQFGHDIGGFLGDPSPELFIRWLEFSAFTPLFRNHSINTALPREPWVYGEPYTSIIREIIETRYRWLPYLYTLFEEASRTATPVLCPTFFYSPDDPETYNQDSEFLLGKNLLVAPVYIERATERTLYLPAGSQWYDYYTDQLHEGGTTITVPAPLEKIPLFVRAGAILPTGPVIQYVSGSIEPRLNIDIYPGPDQDFTLYEDDGVTLNYRQGEYLRTRLSHRQETEQVLFNIESIEGLLSPGSRSWNLTFHAIREEPENIHINGDPFPQFHDKDNFDEQQSGWYYNSENRLLIIQIEETTEDLTLIIVPKESGSSGYWILH